MMFKTLWQLFGACGALEITASSLCSLMYYIAVSDRACLCAVSNFETWERPQMCMLKAVWFTQSVCVRAVGQFRELVEAAEKDRPLCETLKKVLKLTKVRPHGLTP